MSSLGFSETQWILEFNPTEIGAYFLKLKHVISEKLCFVHYLRNGVLTSEKTPKIQGLLSTAAMLVFLPASTRTRIISANLRSCSDNLYVFALSGCGAFSPFGKSV